MAAPRAWSPERPDLDLTAATRELMKEYRYHLLARGLAPGTIRHRIDAIANLAAEYGDLTTITLEQLEATLGRKRRTHGAEARKALRAGYRVFYAWMLRTERMDHDPSKLLEPVHVPNRMGRIVTDAQVLQALELATLPEKAMILLGRLAALRLGEITKLHTDDRESDVLRIAGKGGKMRMVPINGELAEVLDRLEAMQGRGYYFPGRFGGHMHEQSVNKLITQRLGMNPHSLRHAAATAAFRGTGDIRSVQEMLGHASLATTQRYLHIDPDAIRAAANATALGRPNGIGASTIERASMSGGAR